MSGRSGGGALSDEVWQWWDEGCAGHLEAAAEVVPEADVELIAGLHQSEKAVAAVAPGIGARAG